VVSPLSLVAVAHEASTTAAKATTASRLMPLLLMGLIFGVMYVLVIRPRSKKAQAARAEAATADVGSKVLLAGGFVAEIVAVRDDEFDVRLSSDSTATVVKQAVIKVFPSEIPPSPEVAAAEESAATGDESPA
jgi:preprotein translocase subunit YajC